LFARIVTKLHRLGRRKQKLTLWLVLALVIIVAAFWNGWRLLGARGFFLETGRTQAASSDVPALEDTSALIKQFGLIINKLGVLVPVIPDVEGNNKPAYLKALTRGVAQYKGTAKPGEGGNIFIFGHSSTLIGTGNYAQVFASLNELKKGDEAIVTYRENDYRYVVSAKKVVASDDVSVLAPTKTEQLTLMTCWPIGSNAKRLIVILKPKTQ